MKKLKPFVKILICSFTVIISVFLETLVLSQFTQAENDALNSFDYSKIETYDGIVTDIEWDYNMVSNRSECYENILLDNGKKIYVWTANQSYHKVGDKVTVYTKDNNTYEYSERAVAVGYSGFGWLMLGVFVMLIPIIIGGLCFGWKGAISCFFIMITITLGFEE